MVVRSVFSLGVGEDGEEYGMYKDDRVHVAVFGFPGTGKSTFLLSQVYQHIEDRDGFTLIDPHGDLAKRVLSHIPRDQWGNVVYIDPLTAFRYGSVVQINFLEVRDELMKGLVARTFMDSLSKIYARFWGPRLDMILLNAIYVLLDQERVRMSDLYYVIADEATRNAYLSKVTDPKVVSFWTNEYQRMPRDASSSVLTKIYRIIQEKVLVPMFDTYESSIDFRRLMDERRYVIVNLSEGALSSDIANFLGSLILSRIYIAGMSRESVPEDERVPHYLYIDEAHRFVTLSIKDILEALRKYKVYATLVSQYLSQYQREIADAIPSLCDTIITFRVGKDTARALEEFFTPYYTYEDLMQLPNYYFAVSMKIRGVREFSVLKVIDLGFGSNNIEEIIKYSLSKYGNPVKELIEVKSEKYKVPLPEFRPAEYQVLTLLYFNDKRWMLEEIEEELFKHRQLDRSDTFRAINELRIRQLIEIEKIMHDEETREIVRISHSGRSVMEKFIPGEGARAGDLTHREIMIDLWRDYASNGFYVICDTGEFGQIELPDLIIYPINYIDNKGVRRMHPSLWDNAHKFAVEIEIYPEKHPDRVIHNYKKCRDMGMPVIFIVPSEEKAEKLRKILKEANATETNNILDDYKPGNYKIIIKNTKTEQNIEKNTEACDIKILITDENDNPVNEAEVVIGGTAKKHDEHITLHAGLHTLKAIIPQHYLLEKWITMDKNAVEINDHTSENTTAIIRNDGTIKLKLKSKQTETHTVKIIITDENDSPVNEAKIRINETEHKHGDELTLQPGIYTITPIIPDNYTLTSIIGANLGKTHPLTKQTQIIINQNTEIKLKLKRKTEITVDTSAKEITREAILQKIETLINNEYKKHYNDNPPLKEKITKLQEKGITTITQETIQEGKRTEETLLILRTNEILILAPFANTLNTTLQNIAQTLNTETIITKIKSSSTRAIPLTLT